MKVNISKRVWDAADQDDGKLDATLTWVLGYFSQKSPHVRLLTHLAETDGPTVEVEFSDENVNKIKTKFGKFNDGLVSTLLIVAYSLGGME